MGNWQNLVKNIAGKRTKRKLLALFVDDFGSIRVKDRKAKENLLKAGIKPDIYLNDTLASAEDLEALFGILQGIKDKNGKPACATPFTIVANPDFDKIRESGFQEYHREPFTVTLEKYGSDWSQSLELWKEGMSAGIFQPAFHGTEHLNVNRWMEALRSNHRSTMLGFENQSICIPPLSGETPLHGLVQECDISTQGDVEKLARDLEIGAQIFREQLGEEPSLFTPGAGVYSPLLEPYLLKSGIKYLDVSRYRAQPVGDGRYVKQFHYLGQKGRNGMVYIVRNCAFEPVKNGEAAIELCLRQIEGAFKMHKPAIISSHRLNYIGHFDEQNRSDNLRHLKTLLEKAVSRWPEIEFAGGRELCSLYTPLS